MDHEIEVNMPSPNGGSDHEVEQVIDIVGIP